MPVEDIHPEVHLFFYPDGAPLKGTLKLAVGDDAFVDSINLGRHQARQSFAKAAIQRIPVLSFDRLMRDLDALADERLRKMDEPEPEPQESKDWEPSRKAKEKAEELLEHPDLLAIVVDAVNRQGVVGERPLVALTYLATVSRLLPRPLYLLLQGDPSSGKTMIARSVCGLVPPDIVLDATDVTANSLYYMGNLGIKRKVLLLGERKRQVDDSAADATKALRELSETGCLSKLMPVKRQDGSFVTECIELEGPAALIETASHDRIAQEDQTRQVAVWTDDSPEQTRRVLRAYAAGKAGTAEKPDPLMIDAIRAVQALLAPAEVSFPFLSEVSERFPAGKVEARRAFVRVVAVAEASAVLHQRQREWQGDRIIAEPDDLRLAIRVLQPWLDATLGGGIPPTAARVWEAIRYRVDQFTAAELARELDKPRQTVSRALRYLLDAGAIQAVGEAGRGKPQPFEVVDPNWQPGGVGDLFSPSYAV